MNDRLDPAMRISGRERDGALDLLAADLPAPELSKRERDRKELREWLDEWRYWLGGAVIMSAIWGVNCFRKQELTYYWPMLPLGVWAAVLIAIAIWPRSEEQGAGKRGEKEERKKEWKDGS